MGKFHLSKNLENIVRNNVRFDETAPWSYVLYQDKHLPHGESALLKKLEKIKKFAEKHNGYCTVTRGLTIVGDYKEVRIQMNCDCVPAKAFDAVLEARQTPHIYLRLDADRVWAAEVPLGRVDAKAVLFCKEKEYPVELFYYRTDINGSGVVEKDVCQDRNELLKSLNWLGQCGYTPLKLWDFRAETSRDERLMNIFAAGAERRYEAACARLDDMIVIAAAIAAEKKTYSLVLCKGESEEEVVSACLSDKEVSLIKRDMAGEINSEVIIQLADGRKIDTGIIDEISPVSVNASLNREDR